MKVLLIGVGAAGNKAVLDAVERKIMKIDDTIIVNSTTKDFPKGYEGKKIVLGVRPENIVEGGEIKVKVFDNENLGMNTLVHGYIGEEGNGPKITAKLRGWCNYKAGDIASLSFNRKHFFDVDTQNAI